LRLCRRHEDAFSSGKNNQRGVKVESGMAKGSTHSSTRKPGQSAAAGSQFIVHLFAFRIYTYNIESLNERATPPWPCHRPFSTDCYKFQIDFCMALIALVCPPPASSPPVSGPRPWSPDQSFVISRNRIENEMAAGSLIPRFPPLTIQQSSSKTMCT